MNTGLLSVGSDPESGIRNALPETIKKLNMNLMHARIQKVLLQGVNNSDSFVGFFVGGERIQIPLKVGHHRSASKTPFKWHFADGPIVAQH